MKNLDITSVGGILFGIFALLVGFVLEGGKAGTLLAGTAALIVFGGTLAATAVSFSISEIRRIPHYLKIAFTATAFDPIGLIDQLILYNDTMRKANHLALQEFVDKTSDRFIKKALQLLVDNVDFEVMTQQLETELYSEENDLEVGANMFEVAGGFAPTMGIVGTVMGLVHVLGALGGGATALAQAIGAAFIATLYGVASANLAWLPLSLKLKTRAQQSQLLHAMALDGFTMMHRRQSSITLRDRLQGYIHQTAAPKDPGVSARA